MTASPKTGQALIATERALARLAAAGVRWASPVQVERLINLDHPAPVSRSVVFSALRILCRRGLLSMRVDTSGRLSFGLARLPA